MSTLNVSNITDGTTTVGTSYVVNGSAKVFCSFDQYYSNAVRDSFNVSSAVDVSTGRSQFNLTSQFSSSDYSVVITGKLAAIGFLSTAVHGSSTPTASQYEAATGNTANSVDCPYVFSSAHGDLA